ncbi:signal peptidase I [Oleispira antarctica]|uniref:Signal peptidase I n=1 Tax=Oleispira antarctica TaxID=188908 RepID=A0A1Y5HWC0_OLEAN|nr:signal peptidase I [Oleispira antarctica]
MDIDFPLILMVLTVVTGLVTLADKFIFSPKRLAEEVEVKEPVWIEQSKSFFPVLLVVFVLRSFIAEPFQIPSGSMESTLVQGDFILVSKFHYGLRMPVFRNLLVANNEPERGDVMVFFPPHDKRYFIKRVIGLPGDHVVYKEGQLTINGDAKTIKIVSAEPKHRPLKYLLEETLDTGPHEVQWTPGAGYGAYGPEGEWTVPEGHYFMLGDNRGRSSDSRFWENPATGESMSFVPEKNIVGKAEAVWMHWDEFASIPSFSRNKSIQ